MGKVKGESLGNRGNKEVGKEGKKGGKGGGGEDRKGGRRRKEHKHSLFPCPLELHDGCL